MLEYYPAFANCESMICPILWNISKLFTDSLEIQFRFIYSVFSCGLFGMLNALFHENFKG